MAYPHFESAEVISLSRMVREWETTKPKPDDPAHPVNWWMGTDYDGPEGAHPLVEELAQHDENGVAGALAYLAEGTTSNAPALIRWMTAGAFKGRFASEAEFCRDQFADAIEDHFAAWDKRADIGLPEVEFAELIDWEEVADKAVGNPIMDADEQVFYAIDTEDGVYVFDMSIPFSDYEEE